MKNSLWIFAVLSLMIIIVIQGLICFHLYKQSDSPEPQQQVAAFNQEGVVSINRDATTEWLIAMRVTKNGKDALKYSASVELAPHIAQGHVYEMTHDYQKAIDSYMIGISHTTDFNAYSPTMEYAGLARCHFFLNDMEQSRYYYALAIVEKYDQIVDKEKIWHTSHGNNWLDYEKSRYEWFFVRVCRDIINAPYGLRTPFFDSRTFVIFIKEGHDKCSVAQNEVFSKAVSILKDLFGESGPVVYNEPGKFGK